MSRDFFAPRAAALPIFSDSIVQLAMEEMTDGVQRVERELCFVGRITDAKMLEHATRVERQEERELFLTPKGAEVMARMRIRRSTINEHAEDVLTFKMRKQGEQFNKESSVACPEGLFELFSAIPGVKTNEKTRYVFPAKIDTGEIWEVDVYPDGEGGHSAWVKIDLELKEGTSHLELPPFPEGIEDIIDVKTTEPEKKEFVGKLFNTVFFRNK